MYYPGIYFERVTKTKNENAIMLKELSALVYTTVV
jgi:hypothetical protein